MKTAILILFAIVIFGLGANAQKLPISKGRIVYEHVIEAPGKSQHDLHLGARKFYMHMFRDFSYVLQLDDMTAGQIIFKVSKEFDYFRKGSMFGTVYPFYFTLQIDVNDGRSRIKIFDIYNQNAAYKPPGQHLENINSDRLKGTEKSAKKLDKYQDWAGSVNQFFLQIMVQYKTKIEETNNDGW